MQWLIDILKAWIPDNVGYIDRGSISTADFTLVDFTIDGYFHDLDLSAIVPVNARLVLMRVTLLVPPPGWRFAKWKPSFHVGTSNQSATPAQIPYNTWCYDILVAMNEDQKISYNMDNGTWSAINLYIRGWWL